MNEHLADIARRFPLVPRPRPAPLPLHDRLDEVTDLAATPVGDPRFLVRTAAAYNRAALIASDLGRPELARALCWRHHDRYSDHQPWTAQHARLALEPVVNLARLHSRAERPDESNRALESLLSAVRHGGAAEIDGRTLELGPTSLIDSTARIELHRWLWTVVLADGIRALTRVGRFDDALAHAHRHHGVGTTLLDGRQVAVIAPAIHGDYETALSVLRSSDITEQWQRAVAACLEAWVHRHNRKAEYEILEAARVIRSHDDELRFSAELEGIVFDLALGGELGNTGGSDDVAPAAADPRPDRCGGPP